MNEQIRFYESTTQAPWNRNRSAEICDLGPWDRDEWERYGEPDDMLPMEEIDPEDYMDPCDDADASLDVQERQYWETHRVWYDDEDRPHIREVSHD